MGKKKTTTMPSHWGDEMQPKDIAMIRLLVQNIGGIDMTDSGSIKLAALRNFTNEHQITKCNMDWTKEPAHLQIAKQTCYWWESNQWSVSHNTHETNKAAFQPSSMVVVIINQLAHQAQ